MLHDPETHTPGRGPVVLHGVSWGQHEALLAALGDDHLSLRLTFLARAYVAALREVSSG